LFDMARRRYWYFGLSLLVIVPGVIALALGGRPLPIVIPGGTLLELQFPQVDLPLQPADIRAVYEAQGFPDSAVQTSGKDIAIIRSKALDETQQQAIIAALEAQYGASILLNAATVGPSVGAEVTRSAAVAVGMAAVGILLYIWFAFRRLGD